MAPALAALHHEFPETALEIEMDRTGYERLSERAAAYLRNETAHCIAHATSIQIFEPGPLAGADGGVDVEAIQQAIASRLHLVPRLRQQLRWIPIENHPVWIDDPDFSVGYHVRHTGIGTGVRRSVGRTARPCEYLPSR